MPVHKAESFYSKDEVLRTGKYPWTGIEFTKSTRRIFQTIFTETPIAETLEVLSIGTMVKDDEGTLRVAVRALYAKTASQVTTRFYYFYRSVQDDQWKLVGYTEPQVHQGTFVPLTELPDEEQIIWTK